MLKKIREKPHHIKQSIALAVTVVIFSCILFIWISSRDARSHELEVRDKTVSPIGGVASMFDGFTSWFKEGISDRPVNSGTKDSPDNATSTSAFDLSGVVIINPSVSTVKAPVATTTKKTK